MKPEIIVMLTHNDVTVSNARECFRAAAHLPVQFWGFKDVGLSRREMGQLVRDFTDAGKTPVLEVVSFEETDLLNAADLAVTCGVQYFTGGVFSEAVLQRVHSAGMKYFPFCGDVGGSPIQLAGTAEDVVDDANRLRELGADGVDLVAYRFDNGDPIHLAKLVEHQLGGENLIIAGSINSSDRIQRMHEIEPLGYTMGGALFEGAFQPGGTFADNLAALVELDAAVWGADR